MGIYIERKGNEPKVYRENGPCSTARLGKERKKGIEEAIEEERGVRPRNPSIHHHPTQGSVERSGMRGSAPLQSLPATVNRALIFSMNGLFRFSRAYLMPWELIRSLIARRSSENAPRGAEILAPMDRRWVYSRVLCISRERCLYTSDEDNSPDRRVLRIRVFPMAIYYHDALVRGDDWRL